MINLERRPDRRERMLNAFDILGIDAKLVRAVDGKYVVFQPYGNEPSSQVCCISTLW